MKAPRDGVVAFSSVVVLSLCAVIGFGSPTSAHAAQRKHAEDAVGRLGLPTQPYWDGRSCLTHTDVSPLSEECDEDDLELCDVDEDEDEDEDEDGDVSQDEGQRPDEGRRIGKEEGAKGDITESFACLLAECPQACKNCRTRCHNTCVKSYPNSQSQEYKDCYFNGCANECDEECPEGITAPGCL